MEKKTVLITGATRGIGKACALAFAKAGWQIAGCCASSPEAAERAAAEIRPFCPDVFMTVCNVSAEEEVKHLMKEVRERFNRLDALVCCAGINKDALALRTRLDDFERILQVNLEGTFLCCREALKLMGRQREGAIVNISSVVGLHGNAGQSAYSASKAALIGLSKSLAREMGSRNIRVNAIAPGFIETRMTEDLPSGLREAMLAGIPLARFGQPEDVAAAALFLAGEESRYITGQVLQIDGGLFI